MTDHPRRMAFDQTLALLREGYRFLGNRRRRYGTDVYEIRVLGQRAICLVGAGAAELLYDETRFQRAGVMPGPVRRTLVGEGGVQGLDGAAHRHRKAMFMSLMTPERVGSLSTLAASYWEQAIDGWPVRDRVVLFDEAARVLLQAVCGWGGVPLAAGEAAARSRDMVAMIDGFATAGPRHWRGRLARRRSEAWIRGLVRRVRRGELAAPAGSPLELVAGHQDPAGAPLTEHTAAVELLNLVRPTVAIAWYVTFAMHALHHNPQWRERLRGGDDATYERFVQEVRRCYPLTPAVGARVRRDFSWRGHRFSKGRLVLLDVYSTNRDPQRWSGPDRFDPDRFAGRDIDAFELIPQGGGDPDLGHRCAGEHITIQLAKSSLRHLVRLDYRVPAQDLEIPLNRIPTRPRSGFVITQVSRTATAGTARPTTP